MNRILVIRGGAIGDFILTLPAIKLLRDAFPNARLEILGYKHIAVLAENRSYADAIRSLESGTLARFFAKAAELPEEWARYFASFDVVVSYLFDPDAIFAENLHRAGVRTLLRGPGKLANNEHAALQLARPLGELGVTVGNSPGELFPNNEDHLAAQQFLPSDAGTMIALHPGSGSSAKNWLVEKWESVGRELARQSRDIHLLVVGGEADGAALEFLRARWHDVPHSFAIDLPLPTLAAILTHCRLFLGHDSGISHLAAAAGTPCILLFGPTDPAIWAPGNAVVIRDSSQSMDAIDPAAVVESARYELMRIGIRT